MNRILQKVQQMKDVREKIHKSTIEYNMLGYQINRIIRAVKRHQYLRSDDGQKQIALNRMTNWQRNQCMKHFKGCLHNVPLDKVALFCDLQHHKGRA